MRVLVCGGLDYGARGILFSTLDFFHQVEPIDVLVEGGESGAAALAGSWARVREVSHWRVPADRKRDGFDAAGEIRNRRMLDMCKPDLVFAFPGADETALLTAQARAAGVPVHLAGGDPVDPRQVTIFDVEGVIGR